MNKLLVAVTGASGGLGKALLRALLGQCEVKALFRRDNPASRQWAAEGCQIVLGDLEDRKALRQLTEGAQIVFHCAGKVTGFKVAEFFAVNVAGTRNVAEAASAQKCGRFVHVSSAAVYSGSEPAMEFTEDLKLTASKSMDPYSRSKLESEIVVTQTFKNSRTEYTIVRPTFIYGAGLKAWTAIPLDSLRGNRSIYLGLNQGEGLLDAVYVEDVTEGILAAAKSPEGAGQVFNLGHESVTFKEFYSHFGEMVGTSPRFGDESTLRRILKLTRAGSRVSKDFLGGVAIGIESILRMSINRSEYPSAKAKSLLGYDPKFSLTVGMLRTELLLKEQGLLPGNGRRLWNADRHYSLSPAAICHPKDEQEIVKIVQEAGKRRLKVKPIGALHSFAALPESAGVCISLEHFKNVLNIGNSSVTVQGGIKISELNRLLAENNQGLPIHGSNTEQTVAGAISTGTHGGSIHHGTLSDYVRGIRLVKSSGEVIEMNPESPTFGAAIVSLGLLGVVSTVTLECVPKFYLRSTTAVQPLEFLLKNFDLLQKENDYTDLSYYPQTNDVAMLLMNRVEGAESEDIERRPPSPSKFQQRLISRSFKFFLKKLPALPKSFQRKAVTRFMETSYRATHGRSDRVLNFVELIDCDPFPIDDLEFAVPFASAPAVLRSLAEHFSKPGKYRRFFPIHIRCSKGGKQWLSANYARDVCWFEFWQYPPDPAFYRQLHEIFKPFEYRIHWGKLAATPLEEVRQGIPRFDEFVEIRRQFDPDGMFLNDYLERVFK
jgi:nucleoside-diphosphate-sugar epimerase/FAD/FMN-containing dehydrogenase